MEITLERNELAKGFIRAATSTFSKMPDSDMTHTDGMARHRLFPLPVFVATILSFGCRPMSGHVVSVVFVSSMVENVGVAAGIASPALSVQKIFPLPVFTAGLEADI